MDGALAITMLGRLARMCATDRPAVAVASAAVWASLDAPFSPTTVRAVAERLQRWSADSPDLDTVRCLLMAAQDLEWHRLVHQSDALLAALLILVRSVPLTAAKGRRRPPDVRLAHVLAQRARLLRTCGALDAAESAMDEATRIARAARDGWLLARCQLGAGAIHELRGNLPASRACYERALQIAQSLGPDGDDLARGARHGLTWSAILSGRYEDALRECWIAFRGAERDPFTRGGVLSMLACVALHLGRPRAALRAARAALMLEPIETTLPGILSTAIRAAELLGETGSADAWAAELTRLIERPNRDPYTAGDAYRDLALWSLDRAHRRPAARAEAVAYATAALDIARRHDYHELAFTVEAVLSRAHDADAPRPTPRRLQRDLSQLLDETEALPLNLDQLLVVA